MFKGKRMLFRVLLGVQHWTQYKTLVRDVCISLAVSVGMSQAVLYILEFVNYSLGWALDIEASDFINIVVAGIGVAGVLLALYCSNIAAVFSARYSQAPEEVFNLFVNSFITGAGVKAVLFYIAYSLCLSLMENISDILFINWSMEYFYDSYSTSIWETWIRVIKSDRCI